MQQLSRMAIEWGCQRKRKPHSRRATGAQEGRRRIARLFRQFDDPLREGAVDEQQRPAALGMARDDRIDGARRAFLDDVAAKQRPHGAAGRRFKSVPIGVLVDTDGLRIGF